MPTRKYCLAALLLLSATAVAQDKTLTFSNSSTTQSIRLLNGTSVSIGTTGNLQASCVLNAGNTCADIGSGGGSSGGTPPSVSISAGNFSGTPDGEGKYAPGTSVTITPVVSANGEFCVRQLVSGSPNDSGWTGTVAAPGLNNATTVTLYSQLSTYGFSLKCYSSGGSATSSQITISTRSGTVTPPPDAFCQGWTPTLNSLGFSQASNPTSWLQLSGVPFPNHDVSSPLITVIKSLSTNKTYLGASRANYAAVQFTTPSSSTVSGSMDFQPSQLGGTTGAPTGSYYVTISRCPGDFRYAIQAPLQDSSEAQVCKSVRKKASGGATYTEAIYFNTTGVSGDGVTSTYCGLQPNTTYYLNYVNANPIDGITQGEHLCPNNVSNCGLHFKSAGSD